MSKLWLRFLYWMIQKTITIELLVGIAIKKKMSIAVNLNFIPTNNGIRLVPLHSNHIAAYIFSNNCYLHNWNKIYNCDFTKIHKKEK